MTKTDWLLLAGVGLLGYMLYRQLKAEQAARASYAGAPRWDPLTGAPLDAAGYIGTRGALYTYPGA